MNLNRMARLPYFGWNCLASFVFGIIPSFMMPTPDAVQAGGEMVIDYNNLMITFLVILIPALFVTFYLMIRRLHDLDKSGWMSLIAFIPLVNIIFSLYLLFAKGTEGTNRYGDQP